MNPSFHGVGQHTGARERKTNTKTVRHNLESKHASARPNVIPNIDG